MKCGYCGKDFAESQHHYCPEGQRFLLAELVRLRAVNAELAEALHRIASTCENFDGCPAGPQTIAEVARSALTRAALAKPETCVWVRGARNEWKTSCGDYGYDPVREGSPCETCRRPVKIEVKK